MDSSRSDAHTPTAEQRLHRMMAGFQATQMVYVAAKLGIADLLAGGALGAKELAAGAGAHAGALFRLMRALASLGIFSQDERDRFGLTPLSRLLRSDVPGSLRPYALTYGEPWWWQAYGGLLGSVQTGETAFDRVHGKPFFDYLEQDLAAAAVFNDNMSATTREEVQAVLEAYDFSEIQILVDVAGGHGALLGAVLQAYPHMQGVLFDQPSVLHGASERLKQAGVAGRCRLEPGDFFTALPAGGDAYVLKDIVHDWDDERARIILDNCRWSMRDSARLLLVERVIPPGDTPFRGKLVDITMMVMTGGLERTEAEYRRLLSGSGFRLVRVIPTASPSSVVEAIPV